MSPAKKKPAFSPFDHEMMRRALDLAAKGIGYVSPNPMVGCVITDTEGNIIGEGYHERFGKAHAEINALRRIKEPSKLKGATVYVSLEPCSHHGKTPPCSVALGKLPLKRVVVAHEDPNPKVNGNGIDYLRAQGIEVQVGLLKEQAEALNESFIYAQRNHMPLVILKMAQTADGYMAAADGSSQWITSEQSRALVHKWRASYDAVMVGRNTALIDNPRLSVRHVKGRQPYRVVMDAQLELPQELNVFSDEFEEKTIRLVCNETAYKELGDPMLEMLKSNYFRGKTLLVAEKDGHINLEHAFKMLLREGIQSILIEAGPTLASVLIREYLVDKLELFIAPKLLGNGQKAIQGLNINRMSEILEFRKSKWTAVGSDMLLTAWI